MKLLSCVKDYIRKDEKNRRTGMKVKCFMAFILSLFLLLFLMGPVFQLFYENETASAPRGIYLKLAGTPSYGDYVITACPKAYPPLTYEGMPILKKVQGLPGDSYIVTDENLYLERTKAKYPIFHKDYLPELAPGNYSVPPTMYLLLNDMPYSFDSRYMGPISETQIISKAILLINYDYFNTVYGKYIGGTSDEKE